MAKTSTSQLLDDQSLAQLIEECGRAGQAVCGVDEAGRGALAGPVVAAAAILRAGAQMPIGVDDSKKLTAKRRATLFDALHGTTNVGVGVVEHDVIDQVNIRQANYMAMASAVEHLVAQPGLKPIGAVIVDGNDLTGHFIETMRRLRLHAFMLVKGESRVKEIAAASIVAKVTRDRRMAEEHVRHPGYGFDGNAGYGSDAHLSALTALGPCAIHRLTFAPVAALKQQALAF